MCRAATTSIPVITGSLWNEIKSRFFRETSQVELIINANQISVATFVATDNIIMTAKGQKHISRAGANDKRSVTSLTVYESLDGKILPFQLIYRGKTQRSLPNVDFPDGFCLSDNEKHWNNEKKNVRLIEQVLVPYIEKFKEEKGLPNNQKGLLIWDAFKAQSTANLSDIISKHGIASVKV